MRIFWLLPFVLLTGCAFIQEATKYHPHEDAASPAPLQAPQLDPGAREVRVGKSDAPEGYEEVGLISVGDGEGCGTQGTVGTFGNAMIKLKNLALSRGASYVQMMSLTEPHGDAFCFRDEYTISGVAYKKK